MDINNLVLQAQKGSSKAFEELYALVYKDMYYYAVSKLQNADDASDAVSDAVLDAYEGIKKLKDPSKFKNWIFAILSRKINRKYSEYSDYRKRIDNDDAEEISDDALNDLTGVEVTDLLSYLSENERTALTLSYMCGFTSEEISEITNTNPSTVRSHILRAKNKLRRHYFL